MLSPLWPQQADGHTSPFMTVFSYLYPLTSNPLPLKKIMFREH